MLGQHHLTVESFGIQCSLYNIVLLVPVFPEMLSWLLILFDLVVTATVSALESIVIQAHHESAGGKSLLYTKGQSKPRFVPNPQLVHCLL